MREVFATTAVLSTRNQEFVHRVSMKAVLFMYVYEIDILYDRIESKKYSATSMVIIQFGPVIPLSSFSYCLSSRLFGLSQTSPHRPRVLKGGYLSAREVMELSDSKRSRHFHPLN